ncbi:hypothetical protein [Nocardia sp. XZ_19_231]|uniref:hypothetical protein n=1 Tax=Nocardia sp. XZ_19_231 TaxID=2769252 RepID=UPI00188FFDCC|nr:hypothetical protein [Nocardia sp. XZ_19_231]
MDRPDAHRPIGARQHDPGSAGAPLAAVTPIRRSRDLGAPRPRRLSEQPTSGARHRIEGGPTTPAGIPVVSAAAIRDAETSRVVPTDATVTDRLPVVGGKFDPGARHRLSDTPFSIGDNGPDTDRLPIITTPTPGWARLEHPKPSYGAAVTQHSRSTPEDRGSDTFPPRPASGYPGTDTFPPRPASGYPGTDTFPPRPAPDYPDTDAFSAHATPEDRGAEDEPSRTAPDYNGDDEVFARMIDRSKRRRVPRWVAPLVASVAGAVLLGGTYVQLRGPAPASTAASTPLAPSSVSPVTAECPTEQIGVLSRGNGAGGTESGVAAILAFQYAYYVARSGDQARTLVAADAVAPSAAAIQAGIDSTPVGTTHCVEITPGAFADQYLVKITAFRPDSAPSTYTPQLVGTAEVGNKTLITSFGAAPR